MQQAWGRGAAAVAEAVADVVEAADAAARGLRAELASVEEAEDWAPSSPQLLCIQYGGEQQHLRVCTEFQERRAGVQTTSAYIFAASIITS